MTNKNIIKCADANKLETCTKFLNQYRIENKSDLVVDKNGKVLKVNNLIECYDVFYYNTDTGAIDNDFIEGSYLIEYINKTDFYNSEKACEKALKRKEIENKLRLKYPEYLEELEKLFIKYNNKMETNK